MILESGLPIPMYSPTELFASSNIYAVDSFTVSRFKGALNSKYTFWLVDTGALLIGPFAIDKNLFFTSTWYGSSLLESQPKVKKVIKITKNKDLNMRTP